MARPIPMTGVPLPRMFLAEWSHSGRHDILRLVLALCILMMAAACSQQVILQTGLADAEANEIVSLLSHYGIEAKKQQAKNGVSLAVNGSDIARATDVMHAAGLPRRNLANLGEVFKKDGMISTPLEERVRYIHGLSQELEYTLQQFDNVITARVHVVLPERIAPGEPIQPSSAAVFIKYRPPLDEDTVVPRIRNLVANSIPGLSGAEERSKITVVLVPGMAAKPDQDSGKEKNAENRSGASWLVATIAVASVLLALGLLMLRSRKFASHSKGGLFGRGSAKSVPAASAAPNAEPSNNPAQASAQKASV